MIREWVWGVGSRGWEVGFEYNFIYHPPHPTPHTQSPGMTSPHPCYAPRVEWTGGSRRREVSRKVRAPTGSRLANGQAR
jgi:hypothetical protein